MHSLRTIALASVAPLALFAQPAFANEDTAENADTSTTTTDVIIVYGQGQTRQVQEIQAQDISSLLPGTSVIRAIEKLPSVNIQAADPFGNYEWSTRVTIRSFNQNQLGFTFDGVPLGDMSYGNHNGLHISRAVSSENVGSVLVSQGAGSLGTNSTGNLGGTVETFSIAPEGRMGIDAAATYGSNDTMRGFVRVNAGSANGVRGYLSYGYGSSDKFKGEGKQDQHMINAKIVVPIGEDAALDAWASYSDRREQDYQDMSLDMLSRLGSRWDNFFPDYALAIRVADIANNRGDTGAPVSNAAAGTVYPGAITSADDAYYDAAGLRKDFLAHIGLTLPVGDEGSFAIRGYYHDNSGRGLWGTPYVASPNGVPLSMRTTEYEMNRVGAFTSLDFAAGIQNFTVTAWIEQNEFNQARRFYAFESRTNPGLSFREWPKNPFFTQWEFDFTTDTMQYSVADRIDLGMLTLNLGWKGFKVSNEATPIVAASFPSGKISVEDWFQPHAGFNVELSDTAELFGGFTQATRAFASATTTGPFSTNQTGFNAIRDTLKPEQSDTYELGLRFNDPVFNGVVGAYLVNFRNRLLSAAAGASIVGNPNVLQNVGNVRALGFEAVGDLRLGGGFNLFASYSYTDATYRDDVFNVSGTLLAAIKGKTVVDAPKHLLRGELGYDDGALFGRIGANYMSRRFFTYTNDQSVPGRAIVDATLGYRFNDFIEAQLNATNLFDKDYVSTIGSGGFGNSGDRQTLLVGAPQQFFVSLRTSF
ncbi:TonB-dependent receptor [Altererythrobacter lauratis]|uniref:TonB-dependent receptor n=1 Tax=Alteraurantiacibacter lauratis TaxID=2054627 RepID=A0ABV7EBW9_9SPHN